MADEVSDSENSVEIGLAERPPNIINHENADEDAGSDGDELDENPLQHLPEYVIQRVEKLRNLNNARDTIMNDYLVERAALESKFAALVEPLYRERHQVVVGEQDELIAKANKVVDPADGEGEPLKGVPQFWLCAMMHNDNVAELITEDDVDCLESLYDVTCENRPDGKGFTLHFHFTPNDYFENSVLSKTYDVPNLLLSDEPMLKNVKGTPIKWKAGRALTFRMTKKKQRGKGKHAGHVRTVEKKEDLESFFRWFEPPAMPPMDEIDEEEAERLEQVFDEDYEVAQAVRLQLIPQAVLWFTGEAGEDQVTLAMEGDEFDVEG
jgi:nucleosome assembly protein 1-like 1